MNEDLLEKLIEELGEKEAMRELAQIAGFIDCPPTIDEFIDDPYFCGEFLGDSVFPVWREELRKIYPNPFYSPYAEVALTGAIGLGKSTCAKVGMLYDLMKLLYLKDPHETFGLITTKPIVFAFMNTTKRLADSVLFREFNEWLRSSNFFREQAKKVPQRKNAIAVNLPHNIQLISGSRGTHALGNDIYSGILSELNFQGESHKMQAFNQYTQVLRRIESRFFRGDKNMAPGRLWLDSSKTDELGFLEQHIKDAKEPPTRVIQKAIWEVKDPNMYCGEKFMVFLGDQSRDPMILDGDFSKLNIPATSIKLVPIEYKPKFEHDIYGSLRDIAGESTWSTHKAIHSVSKLKKALCLPLAVGKYEVELDFDDKGDRLINYVDLSRLDKNSPYFIHLDLAFARDMNRTGIALTRCLGQIQVTKQDHELNNQLVQENIYRTDLVIAVIPKPGKETSLPKIREFITDLINLGYRIGGISADQFQAKETIQYFQTMGYTAELISVDREREPYDYWIRCINEERWEGPNHPILEKEALELIDIGKKFDHPPIQGKIDRASRPSKDLTDAVAGSVWNCHQNSIGGVALTALDQFIEFNNQMKAQPKSLRDELKALQQEMKRMQRR